MRQQYTINCSQPVSDKIFDISAFEKFLHDRIKVEGRTGNLGDDVEIKQVGDGKIEVVTHIPFSGRYLKYLWVFMFYNPEWHRLVGSLSWDLSNIDRWYDTPVCDRTKKFLKKQQLRDWLRVVSTSKGVYELRFFNVVNEEGEDDDE
jgi:large subunit ribosomal protein L22e